MIASDEIEIRFDWMLLAFGYGLRVIADGMGFAQP
jgi:hypothetical protein